MKEEMLYEKISFSMNELPGWCTIEKAHWLARTISEKTILDVVEIGVFGGRSLIAMAMAVNNLGRGGYVLGIDSYKFEDAIEGVEKAHSDWSKNVNYEKIYQETLKLIEEHDLSHCCGLLRSSSANCCRLIGKIDLLHIDGCHSVISSCRDVESWLPKLRQHGILVFDDVNWESTQEAREMILTSCELIYAVDGWEAYKKL